MLLPKLTKNGHVALETPNYNPTFVAKAKRLNGQYKSSVWHFDPRDFDRVKTAAIHVWGAVEGDDTPLVDVELVVEAVHEAELYFAGRQVLSRRGRDEPVKLGPSVVITSGSFRSSGGSRANPTIGTPASGRPVLLEVRDVPRPLAAELAALESNVRLLPPRNGAAELAPPAAPTPAPPQVESPKPEDKSRRYALHLETVQRLQAPFARFTETTIVPVTAISGWTAS